jgi:AraC-like DNA-binding protein
MRVAKAADELTDPAEQRTSIDAIALGCGFRSRSAFYEAFRRERGVNPGEFRKQAGTRLS